MELVRWRVAIPAERVVLGFSSFRVGEGPAHKISRGTSLGEASRA
jgi:hypothetical protein